mmetsp:Transcript_37998/g.117407  ORF Transcript_37998/g.117407 Transcript_37998/m.117407 type:complete len:246 (-) Transcript_37998:1548-2285(-)
MRGRETKSDSNREVSGSSTRHLDRSKIDHQSLSLSKSVARFAAGFFAGFGAGARGVSASESDPPNSALVFAIAFFGGALGMMVGTDTSSSSEPSKRAPADAAGFAGGRFAAGFGAGRPRKPPPLSLSLSLAAAAAPPKSAPSGLLTAFSVGMTCFALGRGIGGATGAEPTSDSESSAGLANMGMSWVSLGGIGGGGCRAPAGGGADASLVASLSARGLAGGIGGGGAWACDGGAVSGWLSSESLW